MTIKKQRLHLIFCVLFLTAAILFGCSRSSEKPTQNPVESTESITSPQETTETDEALITETRQQFEKLTSDFFLDQVTNSTIDLHFTLKDPSAYGITEIPITFGEYNLEHMKEELNSYKELKGNLDDLDVSLLSSDQQLTYEILYSALENEIALEGYELYTQPLGPTIGMQAQLPVLLAEYVFYDTQDVENYLLLLEEIYPFFEEIIEFEKQKSIAGFFSSDAIVDQIIESCQGYLVDPSESFLTKTFETRLSTLTDLTPEEIEGYKTRNNEVLQNYFVPAYQLLTDELTKLKGTGKNDQGMCFYPNGTDYYEKLIRSQISPSYTTIDEIKNAIEHQMAKDVKGIVSILQSNPDILDQFDSYEFTLTDPNEIIEDLIIKTQADFPELPECNYTIKYVPAALEPVLSPAFYLTPPLDQYQDNTIYINNGAQSQKEIYPILAHEGYPGHLYQTVYFTSKSDSNIRRILPYTSYSEGWAVYVENHSYSFDNGLDPELGKLLSLNSTSMLGLHALLELNVNYYGWNIADMKEYLSANYGIEEDSIIDDLYQTVIANPNNYLEYYIGYMEIINLKEKAEKELGDNFDLKAFHTFILDFGPSPFDILNTHFDAWIDSQK